MENQYTEKIDYSFLLEEDVEEHFEELYTCLRSGKHICFDDEPFFSLIEKYINEWKFFFRKLPKLNLVKGVFDLNTYYYLDFFDSGRGKIGDPSLSRQLTEIQTITGIMLFEMNYQRYFDEKKIIHWNDIQKQIEESDLREQYQKVLFGTVREYYADSEWKRVENRFKSTIQSFDVLGWVRMIDKGEKWIFEIKPAISRILKLYEPELTDFDAFVNKLNNNRDI